MDALVRQEARMMVRWSREGIPAPQVLHLDKVHFRITMERIEGVSFKEALWDKRADGVGASIS